MRSKVLYIAIILIVSFGCSQDKNDTKEEITFSFPKISFQDYSVEKNIGNINFIDSSIYFNPTVASQLTNYVYSKLQIDLLSKVDSIYGYFNTPIRDNSPIIIKWSLDEFKYEQEKYN